MGGVRSQAITCVTPEDRKAHALLMADMRASAWVAPSTARQAWRPPKSMHTSQRTVPTCRLDQTMKPISPSSTPAVTQEVHFIPCCLPGGFPALKRRSTPRRVSTTQRSVPGTSVCIGSAFVAQYPRGGGVFWLPVQYLRGLRDLGHDAWWLEVLWTRGDAAFERHCIDVFWQQARAFGVAEHVALLYLPDSGRDDPPGRVEYLGMTEAVLASRRRDTLLLNLANSVTAPLRAGFARSALFDVDPGTFQLWAREWDMGVGSHDAYLTIGMHLGAPDSPIPLDGVPWARVWPTVHLGSWPLQPPPAPHARYTTVTQWWNNHYAFLDGETYDCNKRSGFLPLLALPQRAGVPLEIAANLHADETEDRALLAQHGWRLVDPEAVAGSAVGFQRYVQASRGEVSATKPAYVKAPCVVEATGAEAHLPASAGLRFFRSLDEAVEALRAVEADHAAAARAARGLAEEVFSTRVVLPGLLAAAGA